MWRRAYYRRIYGKSMPDPGKERYSHARKQGYRSGLEVVIARQLEDAGVPYTYEEVTIPFEQPAKQRRYIPDFVLWNGIVVESKGRFVTADRQKCLLIKEQYPNLDLRFVFSNSRTHISKQSRTTYAKWCEAKGFLYADKLIPEAWLTQPRDNASLSALNDIEAANVTS